VAGLYIHIPFCKQACHYCNFHFSTSLQLKEPVIQAILKELKIQKNYLKGEALDSIYLGGGTPSLLTKKELSALFEQIYTIHKVKKDAEITLEANPDDLTKKKIADLKDSPVNRLSIGIQSFFDHDLKFMNRAHNAQEAKECLENVQNAGFSNLTIDLIYGSPTTTQQQWIQNIEIALSYKIPHISCYCLTVEPQTALAHFVKKGKVTPPDDEKAALQFETLIQKLTEIGYEHYEISNFAKKGYIAKHNSNYWRHVKYLGIGPSAHSFDGKSRQWNIPNNSQYVKALDQKKAFFEKEILTTDQAYNEYILTGLRTKWGCDKEKIAHFGQKYLRHFDQEVKRLLSKRWVQEKNNIFTLTNQGKLVADRVALELFIDIV